MKEYNHWIQFTGYDMEQKKDQCQRKFKGEHVRTKKNNIKAQWEE